MSYSIASIVDGGTANALERGLEDLSLWLGLTKDWYLHERTRGKEYAEDHSTRTQTLASRRAAAIARTNGMRRLYQQQRRYQQHGECVLDEDRALHQWRSHRVLSDPAASCAARGDQPWRQAPG